MDWNPNRRCQRLKRLSVCGKAVPGRRGTTPLSRQALWPELTDNAMSTHYKVSLVV